MWGPEAIGGRSDVEGQGGRNRGKGAHSSQRLQEEGRHNGE